MHDPYDINWLEVVGLDTEIRKSMRFWSASSSDVEGCIRLVEPRAFAPRNKNLSSVNIPVLMLLDELVDKGYTGERMLIQHTARSPRRYDRRNPASKRSYYQAVLASRALFRASVTTFGSIENGAYYRALMVLKRDIPVKLHAKKYDAMHTGGALPLALDEFVDAPDNN